MNNKIEDPDKFIIAFFALPPEIRAMIYNNFNQDEITHLRLVSQTCQEDILRLFDYHLNLNESNPHLRNIINQNRIRSCEVLHFLQPLNSQNQIFKYPTLIKSLVMFFVPISAQNLISLLKQCGPYLNSLTLALTKSLLTDPDFPFHEGDKVLNFECLIKLRVLVDTFQPLEDDPDVLNDEDVGDQEAKVFNWLMKDSFKPKLKSFKLLIGYQNPAQAEWYSISMLSIICKHRHSLQRVTISLHRGNHFGNQNLSNLPIHRKGDLNLSELEEITSLKSIRVINQCNGLKMKLWLTLLKNQTTLENIRIDLINFRWQNLVKQIAEKNFQTLTSVKIFTQDCRIKPRTSWVNTDASIFKLCTNLKVLELKRGKRILSYADDLYDDMHLFLINNLLHLPRTLEVLKISGYNVLKPVLLHFLAVGCETLRSIEVEGTNLSLDRPF